MESFHWTEKFETGLPEVDQQHHRLVDIFNLFSEKLSEDDVALGDITSLCTQLLAYTQYHFGEEESLMSRVGVDQRHIDPHVEAHRHFLADANSIYSEVAQDKPGSAQQLLSLLIHWLAFHILQVDQNMARQIDAIRSGGTPSDAYESEERSSDAATEPLVVALNGIFKVVSARNADLRLANLSLEAKVAERTEALSVANARLEELSVTDSLTGLPNRRHAMRRLADLWKDSLQAMAPLACIMIDADHFKEVNDTYGHDAGDEVLRELAKTLQHSMRNDDIVCRLGGDEFLVICPATDQRGGMLVAEMIRDKVSALRVPTGDGFWHGSISAGVAARAPEMGIHEDLIKLADAGVYAAKRDGRNCVRKAS